MELLLILSAIPAFVGGYWLSAQIQLADKERIRRDVLKRTEQLDAQERALDDERVRQRQRLYGYEPNKISGLRRTA